MMLVEGAAHRLGSPLEQIDGLSSALDAEAYLMKQKAEALMRRDRNVGPS